MKLDLVMITKLEILDTAVKVGLGAAISVLGSYFVAKVTHDRTLQKERAERRRALLESVGRKFRSGRSQALGICRELDSAHRCERKDVTRKV